MYISYPTQFSEMPVCQSEVNSKRFPVAMYWLLLIEFTQLPLLPYIVRVQITHISAVRRAAQLHVVVLYSAVTIH